MEVIAFEYFGGSSIIHANTFQIVKSEEHGAVIPQYPHPARVINIMWQLQHGRSAGKAAAGAIIGGILTGGIGALAGAAIGGRKRDESTAIITVEKEGKQHQLHVRCNETQFRQLSSWVF